MDTRVFDVATMREMAITLLALWGWEPVELVHPNGTVEVRLLHRGELLCYSKHEHWHIWPFAPGVMSYWQPCEWARFSTWALKRCIKLIGERDSHG